MKLGQERIMSDLSRTFPHHVAALRAIGNAIICPEALHSIAAARYALKAHRERHNNRAAFDVYCSHEQIIIERLGVQGP